MEAVRQASISVVIADDHPEFRGGLRGMIEEAAEFVVVGEASDGAEAVALVEELRPQIVLMDLHMPEMDGRTATAEILRLDRPPSVVVLTASDTSRDMLDAIAAGAAGYLLKGASAEELHDALRAACAGGAPLSPGVAGALVRHVRERTKATEQLPPLTDRETKVLERLARGRDNSEIADELGVSVATVKNTMAAMFETLGVDSRAQAAVLAVRAGIV